MVAQELIPRPAITDMARPIHCRADRLNQLEKCINELKEERSSQRKQRCYRRFTRDLPDFDEQFHLGFG